MTETQGWIAIVLLLLILAQLVMVGSEMRGLRKNFTSRIDALLPKILWNRLTNKRERPIACPAGIRS
jgi:branched-subunit amino acid permease